MAEGIDNSEIVNLDEMEETDRPMISSGYFNEKGDRINKTPPSFSKKGLLKSSVRDTKYTGESEASRKRYTAELSSLLPNYLWQAFGIQSMIILSVPTLSQNNLQISITGPHIESLFLRNTETGTRLIRDLSMLVSQIPRPDPLPKNLSDHLMNQEYLLLKKKGSQPPVAVTSAARKQADIRQKKKEDMTEEQIKIWDSLAAVKIITQSQGKGSTSGLDDTSTRLSESPLQVSRNPSKLHTNTAKVTVLPGKEGKENYRVDFSKEQCALLNELDPAKRQKEKERLCSEALDLFKAQLKSRDACSVSNSEVRFPARPRDDVLENPCDLGEQSGDFSGGVTDEDFDNTEFSLSKEEEELLNQSTVHSEAPRIELSQGFSNLTVKKGEQMELKVRIRGQPNPEVKWFKDGEALINNKDYTISKNEVENAYTLVLPVAHESHAGNYTVKATNEHGFDESSASLTIVMKPEVSHEPEIKVEYYEETNIEVKVTAHPKSKVKWLKDGIQIKSTTSERISISEEACNIYKLSIQETVAEDEGVYSFVATNKEGETTGDIKLSVHSEAPTFSTKPKSCYARAGQTTKFEGCVQGIPLPVISWQKADEVIVESERFKMESAEDGTFSLTISDVQETDYAEYSAKATSAVGENSATAELTLTSEPSTFLGVKLPFATKVNEGQPLKLTVKVGGSPLPDVNWYKESKELIPDERTTIILLPDGTALLEIASADSARDSGQYKIVAVNATGEVSSETAVDVKKVTKKGTIDEALPDGVTAVECEPLKLTARVSGHPPESDKPLSVREGSRVSSIPSTESAVVENSATAELTLTSEPPTFLGVKLPFATKVNEGEPLKLTVKIGGSPLPDVKWCKECKELIPDERTTIILLPDGTALLEIASADSARDSGQYKIVAVNAIGEVSSETAVDVKKVPKKGTIDEALPDGVTAVECEPLKLTARVSGHPPESNKPLSVREGSKVSSIPSMETAKVQSVAKEKCGNCTYKRIPTQVQWIECDLCKQWYHMRCANIKGSQVPKEFKCSKC